MSRTNKGNSMKSDGFNITGASVTSLASVVSFPEDATSAILQFSLTAADAATVGDAPIVCVTESAAESPVAGYTGAKGVRLFNHDAVEITGRNNLDNFKMIPHDIGYIVYCRISFYK